MSADKIKVLYVAGWHRSGSTVFEQILGQLEGFFTVGELVHLWDQSSDSLCGCGRTLGNCDTWRRIFVEAFGLTPERFDFATSQSYRRGCARLRHLYLLANPVLRRVLSPWLDPYSKMLERLYRAVSAVTGARVIVDSSKHPTHAYLLELSGSVVPYIVHLVRDPRGCAYSYQINKPHPDPRVGRMGVMRPMRSSLRWIAFNAAARGLRSRFPGRYTLVRYEDFISSPGDAVRRVLDLVGESVPPLPFLSQESVSLQPSHGVAGNASRFKTGVVRLKLDERWKSGMKQGHKMMVTALTSFWLLKYRYSFGLNSNAHAEVGASRLRKATGQSE